MIIVEFKNGQNVIEKKVGFMYDTGQEISLANTYDLPATPTLSFYNDDGDETSVVGTFSNNNVVGSIPDVFLTKRVFSVAVKVVTETSMTTKYLATITLYEVGKHTV